LRTEQHVTARIILLSKAGILNLMGIFKNVYIGEMLNMTAGGL
jgi:hypothetical protein